MDKIIVRGGKRLKGKVKIGGAKNAVLPVMTACLLTRGVSVIRNVPRLQDVASMAAVLEQLGVACDFKDDVLTIDSSKVSGHEAPYDLVRKMRASIYVLGPLLASTGRARVSLPGGCAWGPRPVDLHIRAMRELGASVDIDHGYIKSEARRLKGSHVTFSAPSVGATANTMMAASRARGQTVITNAAREPEITALADFLNLMGARVAGAGSDVMTIDGVNDLSPAEFKIVPDRIETATYMVAGAITAGQIEITDCVPEHVESVTVKLAQCGVAVEAARGRIRVKGRKVMNSVDVVTAPYPGFPTDMQAQFMALMTIAKGTSIISETIFRDRFTHVPELRRLGADIKLNGSTAQVGYVKKLSGAPVMATDLRASAALVLAGLVAEGETHVSRVYHIDRGYEAIEEKLRGLGADIQRMPE
ncbi:MAG: UDP-N-acetylglucosamine 1-carboxyvinyltransferase [bacterium]|jgi:UDP-N-acetylglucosamine 1-carboxyvinyltransferase